jgi:hypothetical protein
MIRKTKFMVRNAGNIGLDSFELLPVAGSKQAHHFLLNRSDRKGVSPTTVFIRALLDVHCDETYSKELENRFASP